SSRQIVDMLLAECAAAGVEIRLGQRITGVEKADGGFAVATEAGTLSSQALVVATGGPPIPKMGASGFGYDLAKRFGLAVVPPRPALVPLTFGPDLLDWSAGLAGVSVDAEVACGRTRFAEGLLFTRR